MNNLIINNIEITTDSCGRFSLNDLHIAAGGDGKFRPNYFLALDSTREMESILNTEKSAFKSVERKRGRYNGGTWVSRELVYAYAMWISPAFNLKVIKTFDDISNGRYSPISMTDMNSLVKKIESDIASASLCGRELARYKKIKKLNERSFSDGIASVQMALGFKPVN